jgi:hypothetical protein
VYSISIFLNISGDETTREKRQVLVLVPQPPVQQQLVLVPAAAAPVETATCGVPAFVCEGPCISSSPGGIKAVKGEYPWLVRLYKIISLETTFPISLLQFTQMF